ncbi:MAG: 6,7-dimethyl-8-ribityllumazine synthase [Paracoccaceae bacterium]
MAVPHGPSLAPPVFNDAPRALIVAAPFYRGVADHLIAGARDALDAAGVKHDLVEVPGALEIGTAIRFAERRYSAFVALGCVIRGETTHYETVCNDSSRALTLLGVERGLCVGNGILTVETMAQAEVRADPAAMNKGGGAAEAALHLLALKRRFARGGGASEGEIQIAGDPLVGGV